MADQASRDDSSARDEHLARLLLGFADGELNEAETAELGAELARSEDLQGLFVSACLQNQFLPQVLATAAEKPLPHAAGAHLAPVISNLDSTLHGPFGYFSSGWPVAYLVATVIVGIGLAIGSLVHVLHPEHIAPHSPSAVTGGIASNPETAIVGRITEMVDGEWANPKTAPATNTVRLGGKYALASGLVEITYDTGAKVVLQGPVEYVVESPNGGFMSVGKLTGSATTDAARGLTIRTPTATIRDIGTEFGVDVNKDGRTSSYVFRGAIEVQVAAEQGMQPGRPIRLTENESVQIERQLGKTEMTVQRGTVDAASFVRPENLPTLAKEQHLKAFRRWQTYSRKLRKDPSLLAYYDCQLEQGLPGVLRNVATGGDRSADGVIENVTWSNGRMPGKHSLQFMRPDDCVRIHLPQRADDLTLAAWVYVDALANEPSGLLSGSAGGDGQVEWTVGADRHVRFQVFPSKESVCRSASAFDNSHLRRWTHLAVVWDHVAERARLYIDGQVTDEMKLPGGFPICIGSSVIGAARTDSSFDFSRYALGDLAAQRGWVLESGEGLRITTGPAGSVNTTSCVTGPGDGWAAGKLALDSPVAFTRVDTNVVQQVSVFVADGGTGTFGIAGLVPAGRGSATGLIGISPTAADTPRTYYRMTTADATELQGDRLEVGHWYDIRLTMDFSVPGGLARLSYRDQTAGQTGFTPDAGAGMQSIRMGLTPDATGRYLFDALSMRASGNAYLDNYSLSPCRGNLGNAMSARNFRGRIDELAIFGRPLAAEEIRRMFECGSPDAVPGDAAKRKRK